MSVKYATTTTSPRAMDRKLVQGPATATPAGLPDPGNFAQCHMSEHHRSNRKNEAPHTSEQRRRRQKERSTPSRSDPTTRPWRDEDVHRRVPRRRVRRQSHPSPGNRRDARAIRGSMISASLSKQRRGVIAEQRGFPPLQRHAERLPESRVYPASNVNRVTAPATERCSVVIELCWLCPSAAM
jgi:hypothetical protein